jgi:hypothetical protein
MPEKHGQNNKDDSRKNQVKRRWTQPGSQPFPLLPKKISEQDVSGGIDR